MSAVSPYRHALGLPAGSIRALLTIMVIGLTCAIMWLPPHEGNPVPIPPYLIYLTFIIIGHFFTAHGVTIGRDGPSPLYMPAGTIRLLVIVALAGTIGWKIYNDPTALEAQYRASLDEAKTQMYLPAIILGGFFVGVVIRFLLGRHNPLYIIHDIQAWICLLAVVGLVISALVYLVINPSMRVPTDISGWGNILAALVAFYFGART